VLFRDDAGPLELQISPGDGVGIDEQLLGEDSNGWNFLGWAEATGGDEIFDLVNDLEIDRDAVRGGDMNLHKPVLFYVYYYTGTLLWSRDFRNWVAKLCKFVLLAREGERNNGKTERAYALNNDQEYFAESTEAYFGTNDFYPFIRQELKEDDSNIYSVLEKAWMR